MTMSTHSDSSIPSTRRDFLVGAATATAAAWGATIIPASALGKEGTTAPSERINLG